MALQVDISNELINVDFFLWIHSPGLKCPLKEKCCEGMCLFHEMSKIEIEPIQLCKCMRECWFLAMVRRVRW